MLYSNRRFQKENLWFSLITLNSQNKYLIESFYGIISIYKMKMDNEKTQKSFVKLYFQCILLSE